MSFDIARILEKLAVIEGQITPATVRGSQNAQQKEVPQLPALFRPKKISVLGSPKDPEHPMRRYMVGDDVQMDVAQTPLEEAIKNVEEDMLSKVKKNLGQYLDMLAARHETHEKLLDRAKDALDELEVNEDPTEMEPGGTEPTSTPVTNPVMPESSVQTVTMEDGAVLEIFGDTGRGFEIRHGKKSLPTKFKSLDDAVTASELYRAHRARGSQSSNADYVEEA
jgi:hypothetical protein